MRVLTRPINSVSLSFLQQGLGGMEYRFPAVVWGTVVFSDQSADRENRALSLVRDFIDVVGLAAAPIPRSHLQGDAEEVRPEGGGLYRKACLAQVCRCGQFQS